MYPGTYAAERPNVPAVIMAGSGETLTWRELDDASNRLAQLLRARGLAHAGVLQAQEPAATCPDAWKNKFADTGSISTTNRKQPNLLPPAQALINVSQRSPQ